MGSGFKKKGGIDMGNYIPSITEQAAYEWGIRNNVYISPKPISTTEWTLDIVNAGKTNTSPLSYKKIEIWKQMYKFYVYYYEKYSGIKTAKPIEIKKVEKKVEPIIENKLF
jgi:hypothetical protein